MTQIGKTLLRGHALRREGAVVFDDEGRNVRAWDRVPVHAKCQCGALSPAGISRSAAKQWHREHKDSLR